MDFAKGMYDLEKQARPRGVERVGRSLGTPRGTGGSPEGLRRRRRDPFQDRHRIRAIRVAARGVSWGAMLNNYEYYIQGARFENKGDHDTASNEQIPNH